MPLNHGIYSELTQKQFELIGKLVVEFSNLEFLLGVLLSRLLITPEFLGRTYTDNLTVDRIIKSITKALEIHEFRYRNGIVSNENIGSIKEILIEVKKMQELRNDLAHYCWTRVSDTKIFGSGLSGKIPKNTKPYDDCVELTNSELLQTYDSAYSTVDRLRILIDQLPELEESIELFKMLKRK